VPPNKVVAPHYTDVKEDMKKKMHVLSCNNLTWTPTMCYDARRKEIDANFPKGWVGLQKLQAIELVQKSRHAQGLRNTISTVKNTPNYSQMKDLKCPFLQFGGTWSHPEKTAENMHLMVFGNPSLIPLLKTQGWIFDYFSMHFYVFLTNLGFLVIFLQCRIFSWMQLSPVARHLSTSV
jgi:hypothetical protein